LPFVSTINNFINIYPTIVQTRKKAKQNNIPKASFAIGNKKPTKLVKNHTDNEQREIPASGSISPNIIHVRGPIDILKLNIKIPTIKTNTN
jgi:hypothetical protein